jgi:SAM-dependent methyltransferase
LRCLTPELLDMLAPDDPRALASRRDLVLINVLMRQRGVMTAALRKLPPPRRLADLGSGDGRFLLSLARRLAPHWPMVEVTIVDRRPSVAAVTRESLQALGWRCRIVAGDALDVLQELDADIFTANLFLHHFTDAALARLLALAARNTRALVACEPRRGLSALAAARLLFLLGCNDVTRHDAVASVRAGFSDGELSRLWPDPGNWHLREYRGLPFSHVFTARHV